MAKTYGHNRSANVTDRVRNLAHRPLRYVLSINARRVLGLLIKLISLCIDSHLYMPVTSTEVTVQNRRIILRLLHRRVVTNIYIPLIV